MRWAEDGIPARGGEGGQGWGVKCEEYGDAEEFEGGEFEGGEWVVVVAGWGWGVGGGGDGGDVVDGGCERGWDGGGDGDGDWWVRGEG